jgi:hypothetical protein
MATFTSNQAMQPRAPQFANIASMKGALA